MACLIWCVHAPFANLSRSLIQNIMYKLLIWDISNTFYDEITYNRLMTHCNGGEDVSMKDAVD